MLANHQNKNRINWLQIAARIVATGAAGFWGVVMLAHLLGGPDPYATADNADVLGIVLAILVGLAILATIYAWRDEKLGGFALITVGGMLTVFALVTAGHNHLFAMLVSGVPFLVAGMLFLAAWINVDNVA